MKKNIFTTLLLATVFANGQLGVNQTDATYKLEITATRDGEVLILNGLNTDITKSAGKQLWFRPDTPITETTEKVNGTVFLGPTLSKRSTATYSFYADGINSGDTTYQGAQSTKGISFTSPTADYQEFPNDLNGNNTASIAFRSAEEAISPFVFSIQVSDIPVATGEKDGRYRMGNDSYIIIQNYMYVQYELFIVDPDGEELSVSNYYNKYGVANQKNIKAYTKAFKGNNIIVDLCGAVTILKSGNYIFKLKYKLMPDAPSFMDGVTYGSNGFPTTVLNTPLSWTPNYLVMASNNWVKYN
ncbi:hypothetical protein [Apibacter sp. HY039]|uniref:hypothetical protein n=1 Tax=Apibacter sp. HY039 TaxID=2501476 RepID=UPI000FEBCB7A|nr:hypothetical protein [Apibacter sp. HY039]